MMKKRNLFAELSEGFQALADERTGKITLRRHAMETMPTPSITPEELVGLRQRHNLSRAVFARYLRINERTLENWEQGRARPNAQATLLIRLVEKYPDTVDRLETIKTR
jgi:putative transcriptional regulator